jgi:cobyrinic acid a,c-diamide synthase
MSVAASPSHPEHAGRGLLIAAPASGSGKTTVTLGLLRALRRAGHAVRGAKSGPDYIDPRFHAAATGAECVNLDAWAMDAARLRALAARALPGTGGGGAEGSTATATQGTARGPGLLVVEGAMGLFDGAPPDGQGSAAGLARMLGLPVLLVVDAARMAQSVTPLVAGFARHDPQVRVAGVILNRVGSARHGAMLTRALAPLGLPVLGAVPRDAGLSTPSRHLGLVQAGERADLEAFLDHAGRVMAQALDLAAIAALATPLPGPDAGGVRGIAPPAQRIAVARDVAFGFAYPHMLADWRAAGAEVLAFSPLADDPVPDGVGFVLLPGGYPELHGGTIAGAGRFLGSLRAAAAAGVPVYGECGGYMVLGDGLTDAQGTRHAMAGLLRLETSFAARKLHLGYRELRGVRSGPGGDWLAGDWAGHEFHYATTLRAEGPPLFAARDGEGAALVPMGLRAGTVAGSFAHLIDRR